MSLSTDRFPRTFRKYHVIDRNPNTYQTPSKPNKRKKAKKKRKK